MTCLIKEKMTILEQGNVKQQFEFLLIIFYPELLQVDFRYQDILLKLGDI